MILFWLICAGLVAIALAFLLPTLLQRASVAQETDKEMANVEVYRDQLSELDADLANGIVSPEQYRHDRDEIERRLLEDVREPEPESRTETKHTTFGGLQNRLGVSAIAVAIVSLLLPRFGLQSKVIALLGDVQPALGIVLVSFGLFLLLVRSSRSAAYALALGLPIVAVSLYLTVGNPHGIELAQAATPIAGTQQGIEANIAALAKRLEQDSGDAEGWAMLGRSYLSLERYNEASNAYAKAAALKATDADILIEYAFALAMANGRQLQGRPAELIKQALVIAPENPKVLQLAGTAEFEAKNYKQAIIYWQKLLGMTNGSPELAQSISKRIEQAKSLDAANAK